MSIFGCTNDDWITDVVYQRPGDKVRRKRIGCTPHVTQEQAQRLAIRTRVNSMRRRINGTAAKILEIQTRRRYET